MGSIDRSSWSSVASSSLQHTGKARVLLPITVVMLLVGILRHYAMQLLQSDPKPISLVSLREQRILLRASCFRSNGHFLTSERFESRRAILIKALDEGSYLSDTDTTKPTSKDDAPALPTNPFESANMDGMMDGMKKQMVMMVPQTVVSILYLTRTRSRWLSSIKLRSLYGFYNQILSLLWLYHFVSRSQIMGWINAFFFGFVCGRHHLSSLIDC